MHLLKMAYFILPLINCTLLYTEWTIGVFSRYYVETGATEAVLSTEEISVNKYIHK